MVFLAALFAGIFQYFFRKEDKKKSVEKKINGFNEIILYTSSYKEDIVSTIESLILACVDEERQVLIDMQQRLVKIDHFNICHKTIKPFEIDKDTQFISKILYISEYAAVGQAYIRMQRYVSQFNSACEERYTLLIDYRKEHGKISDTEVHITKLSEIHNRTLIILFAAEGILDSCTYIANEFSKIGKKAKENLKKDYATLGILKLEPNPTHEEIRKKAMAMLDEMEDFNPRFLHMRPEEPTKPQSPNPQAV